MSDLSDEKSANCSSSEHISSGSSQKKVRNRGQAKGENVNKNAGKGQKLSKKGENKHWGDYKDNACSMFCNTKRFIREYFVLLLIVMSILLLISFKYFEEKYAHESYLDDRDSFDYYEVLKCKKGDTIQKIKKNYRDLSKQYHPDSNKNCTDCEKKFQEITKAYKTLSDPRLKEAYDKTKGKTFKLIESNTVNLNERNYTTFVENSNNFWVIQIYSDTESFCISFSKIWEETYDKYKDFLHFGRINVLTDKKLIKQKVPFNVKIFPTVFILAPDNSYQIYPNIFNASTKDFQQFIVNTYPNFIYNISTYNKLSNSTENDALQYYIDNNHSILLLTNKPKLGLAIKHVSYTFRNIYKTYTLKYNEINTLTNSFVKESIIDTLKKLSIKKEEYITENEKFDYFLLVDNKSVKMVRRISQTNISHVYADSLRTNFVGVDAYNIGTTCGTTSSRHTYCYVVFVNNLQEASNLESLKKIYKYLNNSFVDFTSKLDKESVEGHFFIQPVYILTNRLTKKFKRFIREKSLDKYNAFFLDYSSNTFAPIEEIKNLSDYAEQKDQQEFLTKIYKDIEILTFQKIPDYCLPFNIECLYNEKHTLSYKIYSAILKTTKAQIIVSTIIAYLLAPSVSQFGKAKYGILTAFIFMLIFVMNIRNFISVFFS